MVRSAQDLRLPNNTIRVGGGPLGTHFVDEERKENTWNSAKKNKQGEREREGRPYKGVKRVYSTLSVIRSGGKEHSLQEHTTRKQSIFAPS